MYRGFNVQVIGLNKAYYFDFMDIGNTQTNKYNKIIADKVNSFVLDKGTIDGTKMQSNWFPTIDADVFISHSHKDKDLAIAFAGWLKSTFGLNAFIDSCVWGYSNDLLKKIDENYCKTGDNLYSYEDRNFSTSHVHMMLASALTMMIDHAETLFFLNTPQSLSTNDIMQKTRSPWIYFELTTSRFIRKPIPERRRPKILNDSKILVKTAGLEDFEYTVDFTDFIDLGESQLNKWKDSTRSKGLSSLDSLYELHPLD